MCLARTNWDVPKHRGLTMFIVKIHQPGIQVEQIRQVDGSMEFCQEFFDDVAIPAADVVGEVDDGWTVATRLLVHERNAVGGGSPYTSGRSSGPRLDPTGRQPGRHRPQPPAEPTTPTAVSSWPRPTSASWSAGQLVQRITQGVSAGKMAPPAGSLLKLFSATNVMRRYEIGLELAGDGGGGLAGRRRTPRPAGSAS